MWILLLAAIAVAPARGHAQSPPAAISIVGEFSDMKNTGEHSYGYTVELWQQQDHMFGFFMASEGLAGDTPTGILENVKFDPRTGELWFDAKLTMGITFLGEGKQAPSRDFFEFQGKLTQAALIGLLKRSNRLQPSETAKVLQVRLRKQKATAMANPPIYAEWRKQADELLKRRGPKWK